MRALIWTKEPGLKYDKEVEVIETGVGLFGTSAIILDPDTGKLKKVPMIKLKVMV